MLSSEASDKVNAVQPDGPTSVGEKCSEALRRCLNTEVAGVPRFSEGVQVALDEATREVKDAERDG